tara:strand:+ start:244 stop:2763 length:2520 start_codon:yes stop_codon:yes gene_type:complete
MYQNIYIKRNNNRNEVHIWDDTNGYYTFQYKPYAYLKHASGTYRSLYGDKLKKVNYWEKEDIEYGRIFESDVPIETRVLVDRYTDSDEPSMGHREMIFDIEVEVTDGFPDPSKANNKITSIAIYDRITDGYVCLILGNVKGYKKDNAIIESFSTEEELLQRFYQKYLEISPTILTGWNIDGFDIPYLYNRTVKVMGIEIANCLSPIGEVFWSENKNRYKIAGVSCLDYLGLYRLYNYSEKSSYRLDVIGKDEVGIGKIEYEGTLQDLYENDINRYVEYNLNDVVIVKKLDDKLQFIDLARGIAHKGRIPYEEVYHSSRYLEGAILAYLKNLNIVAPNKPGNKMDNDIKFSGAYVKDPIPGRYDWVYDLDLTSMYPSTIMTLNISPEMKLGKLDGWNSMEYINGVNKNYTLKSNGKSSVIDNEELKKILDNNKISISSNGVLYRNDKKGLIPILLEKWFNERVEYKTLMKKYGNEGEKEKYGYFKRRQHVQKIILNSLYGVLGLPVFRFYDLDNAEATTTTGVELIKFTEKIANKYYNNILGDGEDYCIYTDTDSVFYPSLPLIKKYHPNADYDDDEFMTKSILEVAESVQNFINESYNLFAKKFLNCDEHRFDIKQECVARSAFWVTKKRYGQWIINDGGVKCDRLDVKGLDIVRSSFPPAFRKFMTELLKSILTKVDKEKIDEMVIKFKNLIKTLPIEDISLPTGVKGINKYIKRNSRKSKLSNSRKIFTDLKKGAPVHVKSSIIYNDLLKYFNVNKKYEPIRNSEKIKWCYLKQNSLGLKTVAFKGYDDPPEIIEFIEKYIDHDRIFQGALKKKLDMFYDSMKWTLVDKQNTIERFF